MKLLERDSETTVLSGLLDIAGHGNGSVAVVTGPAGSGKTALMTAFADEARSGGARVETAVPTHAEAALRRTFATAPAGGAAVLWVDDVQDLDPPSLGALLRLAAEARAYPVLVVLGMRPALPLHEQALAELAGLRQVHRMELGPLSEDGVRALGRRQFGLPLDSAAAAEAASLAGGNTALLHAILLDHHRASPSEPDESAPDAAPDESVPDGLPLGRAYRSAVLGYHFRMDAEQRKAAQAMAVLGEFGTPRSIAEVAQTSVGAVDRAARALASAGLLEHGRFRHSAAEEAVLSTLSSSQASALRKRAAAALRAMGAPVLAVARQLIAADDTNDTWTDTLLHETVIQALAANDRDLAVSALRLALRDASAPERRAAILTQTAQVLAAQDPDLSCQYFHEAGAFVPLERLWAHHAPMLTEQMIRRGRPLDALNMLAAAERGADRAAVGPRAGFASARLLVCAEFPGLLGTAPLPTESGTSAADRPRDPARALVSVLTSAHGREQAGSTASEALYATPFNDQTAPALLAALTTLLHVGNHAVARSFADKLAAESAMRRALVWQARFGGIAAAVSLAQGRYVDASDEAEHALGLMSPQAWGVRIAAPLATLALGAVMTGDRERARIALGHALPPGVFESTHGLAFSYARGHLSLADGRPDAALNDFLSCGRLMASWRVDLETVLPWRLAVAGALLAQGDQEGAVRFVDQRLEHLRQDGTASPDRPELPWEDRSSRREYMFGVLLGAVQRSELVEGIRLLTTVDPAPGPGPARYRIEDRFSQYLDKLTYAERKVAMLAATGSSNRIIARSLSVTISTVEQHLTRTYKKLGLAGRRELRAKLG